MKKVLFFAFLLISELLMAQAQSNDSTFILIDSLKAEIENLKNADADISNKINQVERNIQNNQSLINERFATKNQQIDSLNSLVAENSNEIQRRAEKLELELKEESNRSNESIAQLQLNLSNNTLYWILAIAFAIILAVTLFFILRRTIKKSHSYSSEEIEKTRITIEQEIIKLDNKLLELLEKQITAQQLKIAQENTNGRDNDHSLALKVADEIVRIQKNLSQMDDTTRGKKQLNASVERIRTNFEANGYEIVDMLNKSYNEGLNASVTYKDDDNLPKGSKIISRIIKPQVNYSNIMIQPAQIEVSQNI